MRPYFGSTDIQRDGEAKLDPVRPLWLVIGRAETGGRPPRRRVIAFDAHLEIGREENPDEAEAPGHWGVADRWVSVRHACVRANGPGSFALEDYGSTNGTFVDGRRVEGTVPLREGALVFVGGHAAVFRLASPSALAAIQEEAARPLGPVATSSPELAPVCGKLRRLAATSIELLLVGETGSGKEVYARAVHQLSRRSGAFLAINCAAIPGELVESELFGYARGAHSTAQKDKPGLLEQAAGGTLFLDEVGDMPAALQAKLLRVLQERQITPLGAVQPRALDVRIIAATNQAIETRLRPDLLARFGAEPIRLPPLAARIEDLGALIAHFLPGAPRPLTTRAFRALCLYPWPRNVRELEQVMHTAVALATDSASAVDLAELPEALAREPEPRAPGAPATPAAPHPPERKPRRPAPSAEELEALLRAHNGNVADVARALDRKWQVVWRWLKAHGLEAEKYRSGS